MGRLDRKFVQLQTQQPMLVHPRVTNPWLWHLKNRWFQGHLGKYTYLPQCINDVLVWIIFYPLYLVITCCIVGVLSWSEDNHLHVKILWPMLLYLRVTQHSTVTLVFRSPTWGCASLSYNMRGVFGVLLLHPLYLMGIWWYVVVEWGLTTIIYNCQSNIRSYHIQLVLRLSLANLSNSQQQNDVLGWIQVHI